ncbi:uncharacterized protein PFL1_01605 [Pseudozyma flocculosa PF-1]|uniref:MICOS complex subunit n=1 Tax=Pseudozyma flocculosa TaxID=84751 RepID=A0A5C3EXX5_9BASI|nr:uncharacterized protein PFL1_01605 [Pseudozyma flocculosa PF-1]EPQ30704.1 hypothetical protein PFL1_01605 [Pseudozyma flocculosa PF-1]SPO36952.1 uncharacterized protein PSFLO_02424 [Pseudozyma flocculosa]
MVASILGQTLLRAAPLAGAGALLVSSTTKLHAEEAPAPSSQKLPIYPLPEPEVKLVPTQTELERQIGSARRGLQGATKETREALSGSIEKWIGVERKIEKEVKSLVPADEPLTPGLLYVGVATLTGSVFTRFRSFPIRFITPPLFLVASLNYFQPKLATNLSSYYVELEKAHAPALTEQRESLVSAFRSSIQSASHKVEEAKSGAERGLRSGLSEVEKSTGLKVGDVLGSAEVKAKEAKIKMQDQMRAV